MVDTYLGIDLRRGGLLAGLVLGTAVLVTVVYASIFGFDHWRQDMRTTSQLMMAANQVPVVTPAPGQMVAGQYVCPLHGAVGLPHFDAAGVPHCPLDGQVMALKATGNPASPQQGAQAVAWPSPTVPPGWR